MSKITFFFEWGPSFLKITSKGQASHKMKGHNMSMDYTMRTIFLTWDLNVYKITRYYQGHLSFFWIEKNRKIYRKQNKKLNYLEIKKKKE